jgi:hypothetical protein
MNPLISPSAIILQSSLCSQQQVENFLNTSNRFPALEMATFVSYTYIPTAPRSKSATARRKPASKQSSILDKIQAHQAEQCSTSHSLTSSSSS